MLHIFESTYINILKIQNARTLLFTLDISFCTVFGWTLSQFKIVPVQSSDMMLNRAKMTDYPYEILKTAKDAS